MEGPTKEGTVENQAGDVAIARALASDPRVLLGAWRRVLRAGLSFEWLPTLEFQSWQADPERHLRHLAASLGDGTWRPEEFPEVPYLKRNARIRHYVRPSVRDQVAFMALYLPLAPWMELQMLPLSFANRWHRPSVLEQDRSGAFRWKPGPFRLVDGQIFAPYAQAYARFERCLRATASAMVGNDDTSLQADLPNLPWLKREAWEPEAASHQGHWAKLDFKSAFPSVDRTRLGDSITALASAVPLSESIKEATDGWPEEMQHLVSDAGVRLALAHQLTSRLNDIRYAAHWRSRIIWSPETFGFVDEQAGLPTGLLISSALYNVYLHQTDIVCKSQWDAGGASRVAVLRFSDDIYVFSKRQEAVRDALKWIPEQSGSTINWSKLKPDEWRKLERGEEVQPAALTRTGAARFLKNYSEVLSGLDEERPMDRLARGHERREALIDLVQRPGESVQIHGDTVVVFALNRLIRSLPVASDDLANFGATLSIRRVVEQALLDNPGRAAIWRQVVRVACRPDPGLGSSSQSSADWLADQLRRIRPRQFTDNSDIDAWWDVWPGGDKDTNDWSQRRDLVLALLRVTFWRELATTLVQLDGRQTMASEDQSPHETAWHVRNVPDGELERSRARVGDVSRWADILYGDLAKSRPSTDSLELVEREAVAVAVLRATPSHIVEAHLRMLTVSEGTHGIEWLLQVAAEVANAHPSTSLSTALGDPQPQRQHHGTRKSSHRILNGDELELLLISGHSPELNIASSLEYLAERDGPRAVAIARRLRLPIEDKATEKLNRWSAQEKDDDLLSVLRRRSVRDALLGAGRWA